MFSELSVSSLSESVGSTAFANPLAPRLPTEGQRQVVWGHLHGAGMAVAVAAAVRRHRGVALVVTPDSQTASRFQRELQFFSGDDAEQILLFPDWETLPYDLFSPHEDIVSQRLETLHRLPSLSTGVLIVPVMTLMQRLAPRAFLDQYSLMLERDESLDRDALRARLEQAGYSHVSQVVAHGEYAVRGSIIDLYPMGSPQPYRLDLFDEQIESIRTFDPETQLSTERVDRIRMLPAREFPTDDAAVKRFRQNYRVRFEGDPNASPLYRDVSKHLWPAGIEYYLPMFFSEIHTLFDYLPSDAVIVTTDDVAAAAEAFEREINGRYEQRRHDLERPLLPPEALYLSAQDLEARLDVTPSVCMQRFEIESADGESSINYAAMALPNLSIQGRAAEPGQALRVFLQQHPGRVLFTAESPGRREHLLDVLRGLGLHPEPVGGWREFQASEVQLAITVAALEEGLYLRDAQIILVPESVLFAERAQQRRRRKTPPRDAENVIRNLTDLHAGAPVVHEEHGVGRYRGLQKLQVGGVEAEFLTLEYAGGDKLYVPVSSLHLISRYTGASPENAPLHRLGGDQWQRIKRKAAEKARDVAAELLDIYARRAVRSGIALRVNDDDYAGFASAFPFEETPDQQQTIDEVLADMASQRPMDRVVCGDVGFGKTEVAMRAAFVAVHNGKQVAVLVPTTLLAQQHVQTFTDRFADWPIRIEALSRFKTQKQHKAILRGLAQGSIDIVIGTHRLLQKDMQFKALGLVIVDEEHRFGVRHKERLKALRSEVDLLTLTATPIPRTLNMSFSGLRDLSIIATPPVRRHAVKTFVREWNDSLIQEACQRELKRGGQVYFLHNKVETIERTAEQVQGLLPQAGVKVAHGQMRERELEHVMLDFYHQRFNILVCTTIIESGIDIPTANTIVINRADKLGLSQLHQLRGRVGRSHHRAFAYLIAPPRGAMTADAVKRLEAIESLEDLGVGFMLATHDLEIRGAGELLGEEQSGQIQEIGFSLYNELLDRAVRALRAGEVPNPEAPLDHGSEVDLGVPALLPHDYIPDVHMRLILYKRIASAPTGDELRELQVEMIDRFGLLPEYARNLLEVTRLKLEVAHLGITKLEVGSKDGRILFDRDPRIDVGKLVQLIQREPQVYKLDGQHKLLFAKPMETLQARIEAVAEIVDTLVLKEQAA